ncbi:MAG: hypothetical protein LC645_08070 [Geobacteraceae bacterium]|nr:hypothetical protein [Geobacteraceae bacterium]
MISVRPSGLPTLLIIAGALCAALAIPAPAKAQLHDPMRPGRASLHHVTDAEVDVEDEAALPPLNAILIGANSKVAIFADQRVSEGERIGRFRVTRIHPGRVELSDGETHLERRLFPVITAIEDKR